MFKASGTELKEASCSGDRIAFFTVQTDDREMLKRNLAVAAEKIKVLDYRGNDLLRHELMSTFE